MCVCMCVHVHACVCVCVCSCMCAHVHVYCMVCVSQWLLLRLFLVLGVVWIIIFTVANIGRMYSLQLLDPNVTIVWYHGKYFG